MVLPSVRWLSGLLLVLIAGLLLAQKAQRPPEVEEDPPKQGTKPPEVEETPIVKKRSIRVDEDPDPPKRPQRQPDLVVDLAKAARDARLPVKTMFNELARPIDRVNIKGLKPRTEYSEPIPFYVPPGGSSKGKVTLRPYKADGQPGTPYDMQLNDSTTVEYYENIALLRVEEFRNTRWENLFKDHPNYLPVADQLLAVEQVLTAVMRFHEAARKSGDRQGDEWNPILENVRKKLLAVVLERLQLIVEKGDWDEALALAQQLNQRFPAVEDQKRIAKPLGILVEQVLAGGLKEEQKYQEVQRRLKAIADNFPLSDTTESVSKGLYDSADKLVAQAKQIEDSKPTEAARLVQQAEEICPQYPGIGAYRLKLAGQYPTLRVGVPQLPVYLSPALAHTEAETQAIEMMFESLVQLQLDEHGGTFVGQLAPGRPHALPLGREFVLPSDLYWTNRKPLTALDVGNTVKLLRGEWGGRNEVWRDLLENATVDRGRYRIKVQLSQGYIEPLALMNFKILPPNTQPDDRAFARKPISSGPFEFHPGTYSDSKNTFVTFKANPYYSNRAGRRTLPRIREIQFYVPVDPVDDMRKGFLHLMLDLPAEKKQLDEVRQLPNVTVSAPMPTRRVYFLAVNHRNSYLAQPNFRRALALAVDRETLLNKHFRPADGDKMHDALNGPYPPHSWAYNAKLKTKADPFDAAQAKTQLELAEKAKPGCKTARLWLKYPSGDPRVKGAVMEIAEQIKTHLGLELKLVMVAPHELWEQVREKHDYDLAYWHHDYPDPMFDVWPLFDPRGMVAGGWNYLGYEPSADFTKWFQDARSHRDFTKVRDIVHTIHELLYLREMPLIPLWHLHRQIAVSNKLTFYQGTQKIPLEKDKPPSLDPLRLFGSVETWKLDP